MLAAMMVSSLAMVSCKGPKDPIVTPPVINPGETVEVPEVEKPADGYVTFVIQAPAECHGIAFKGTSDGSAWTGADQYLDAEGVIAGADKCAVAEAIKDAKGWYKLTIKLGATPWGDDANIYLAGKICQIFAGDASWQGQAVNWEYADETTAPVSKSDDGNIQVNGTGLVYVTIEDFQKSECVASVQLKGKFTANFVEALPAGAVCYMTGNFDEKSWGDSDREMTKVTDTQYTWEGEYPEKGFEWKVFYKVDGGDAVWAAGDNVTADEKEHEFAF